MLVRAMMFGSCRDGNCGECLGERYVSLRRDAEPAIDAPMCREECSCDCHWPELETNGGHDAEPGRGSPDI